MSVCLISLFFFSWTLITISFSLPIVCNLISPKFNFLIFVLKLFKSTFSLNLTSIKVPPVKSMPRFRPLKKTENNERVNNIVEINKVNF